MTNTSRKYDVCKNNKTFAYYSGYGGLEFKYIEYGVDDYLYLVSGAWHGTREYHRNKIHYETKEPYILFKGIRIHLSECTRC